MSLRSRASALGNLLFGRPLASSEESEQRVGPRAGIPIFGLDALGSAAYGPEAALTVLLPAGAAGILYIPGVTLAIVILLGIVYFSYRQTIAAYPTGGGSYTVARQNLGPRLGLLAGTALMIDYLLNVAVGISTGVGAIVSAVPPLQPHTLPLCLGLLLILTFINLRGVRETGIAFMAPTYVFIGCLAGVIALGVVKALASGGHPAPVIAPHQPNAAAEAVSAWLLLRAFAGGCTAMTGVEAVSNGVQAFREPVAKTAQRTLTMIIAILMLLLAGIGYLVRAYHIEATPPGRPGYESLLSQLTGAVAGKGAFYYLTIGAIVAVLSLSANTSFAGFPRLCRAMAQNGYLPYGFAVRGRRLVYSWGVYVLALLAGVLLVIFGGVTDRLIPLFAIGAFLSFTLSQAGMVMHWRKQKGRHARASMAVNALGAAATGATVLVVAAAKFTEGAWITLALVPALLVLMVGIRRHYHEVAREISSPSPLEVDGFVPPLVVVPVEEWNRVAKKALQYAMTLSDEVQVLHVDSGEEPAGLQRQWREFVEEPLRKAGRRAPELVVLKSPYRAVVDPILGYVRELAVKHPERHIAVVVSELVERRWYQYLLHKQRAEVLTALLMLDGDERIAVVNVPWYLRR
ncbi:MAG TPA: APC family permease [Bryobacteraceae bacterium]|nr:APC family permease [Bryobacteraceae bacterium]